MSSNIIKIIIQKISRLFYRFSSTRVAIVVLYTLSYSTLAQSQDSVEAKVFSEEDYLEWVKSYHPIMQQARLLGRQALAYQLKAKGGFDPKFFGDVEHKTFDGKNYFTIGDTGLKFPSWLGLEFKAGYYWTNGIFLNPENYLPSSGQAYAGLSWSLGRGFGIDERRATLQKASIIQRANEAERKTIVNDLLLDAGKAYWNWVQAYNDLKVHQEALELASIRLDGTKNSFFQGDKPAVDTLEALIQVQNRQINVNDATVAYENASQTLSNFLWYQNDLPVEVSELLSPPLYQDLYIVNRSVQLADILRDLPENHPSVQQLRFKLQELEVDRRLKKEQLKPQVDVEFNFLADGFDFVNQPSDAVDASRFNALLAENYKVGVKVGMPLFFRKERGDLELADLKLLDTNLKIRQKGQEITNKVINYNEQLENSIKQITINQTVVDNYQRLLDAENEKFRYGESSIFLLNSREQKLVEAQLKFVKLLVTYQKNRLGLIWATGQLQ